MGFFGSGDKNQSTTNTQIGASEDANLEYLSGSNQSKGGLLGLTNSSIGQVALGGVSLGGANSGSIVINDTKASKELAEKFTDTLKSVSESSSDTVDKALKQVVSLSESRQTEGISSLGKIALWGVGIVAGGFILWKWIK